MSFIDFEVDLKLTSKFLFAFIFKASCLTEVK